MYIIEESTRNSVGKMVAFHLRDAELSCIFDTSFRDEYKILVLIKVFKFMRA